jgi:hypothetical protein
MHRHPKQSERVVVHQGALQFVVGGRSRRVAAGDELVIERRVLHCAYNASDVPALATWETRPALRSGELFLARDRASRGRKRPPLLAAAAILNEYRDEFGWVRARAGITYGQVMRARVLSCHGSCRASCSAASRRSVAARCAT